MQFHRDYLQLVDWTGRQITRGKRGRGLSAELVVQLVRDKITISLPVESRC